MSKLLHDFTKALNRGNCREECPYCFKPYTEVSVRDSRVIESVDVSDSFYAPIPKKPKKRSHRYNYATRMALTQLKPKFGSQIRLQKNLAGPSDDSVDRILDLEKMISYPLDIIRPGLSPMTWSIKEINYSPKEDKFTFYGVRNRAADDVYEGEYYYDFYYEGDFDVSMSLRPSYSKSELNQGAEYVIYSRVNNPTYYYVWSLPGPAVKQKPKPKKPKSRKKPSHNMACPAGPPGPKGVSPVTP